VLDKISPEGGMLVDKTSREGPYLVRTDSPDLRVAALEPVARSDAGLMEETVRRLNVVCWNRKGRQRGVRHYDTHFI
jgi:hypothetical protein